MNEITLFKTNKIALKIFMGFSIALICASIIMLFVDVSPKLSGASNLVVGLSSLVIAYLGLTRIKKDCFFRYDNTKIEYRFPHMESQKEINIEGIHSVKEEWFGVSFVNSEGQTIEFSTDGLSKKEKRQIVNIFMELSVATQFIAS